MRYHGLGFESVNNGGHSVPLELKDFVFVFGRGIFSERLLADTSLFLNLAPSSTR